ncbi:MAG: hypothetical protein ABI723_04200 [Bacteroidia bacterium]
MLTKLQLELLEMFNYELNDEQLRDVQNLLAKFYAFKAREEMNKIWDERGWTNETMENFLEEHMRTPYKNR